MVVVLIIQHAKLMGQILLSYVGCLALQYYLKKKQDFSEKILEQNMCFDFLFYFVWDISRFKKNSARY